MTDRVIAHVDMDAFFAAIEQRDNPQLRGKPVIVGADPKGGKGRGVVSTCSYEARQFGIRSAMPISQAYVRCPQAIFLPVRMRYYEAVSQEVFSILDEFSPDVEPVSIDEAFLDLSGTQRLHGPARVAATQMKQRIKQELGLTASIGLAPNKFVAKIACDYGKPDGLFEVDKDNVLSFLWPLDVGSLWGVGPKAKAAFARMNIFQVGDLAKLSAQQLVRDFGAPGAQWHALAHGIDTRIVQNAQEAKSVSREQTFDQDIAQKEVLYKTLLTLSEQVSRRLRREGLQGRTITMKVRLKGFQTFTRAMTLSQSTNFVDDIFACAKQLFDGLYVAGSYVRLLGVKVSGFHCAYARESLFEDKSQDKKERVHKAVDAIKDKFGEKAIHRAV